jgi:hypothetical protein
MEIAPIVGIRVVPVVKRPQNEREITAVFDVTSLTHTGDDSYTSNGRQSAGGQDDDTEDNNAQQDETPGESTGTGIAAVHAASVNFVV